MQADFLGQSVDWRDKAELRDADLVFWSGHVGIFLEQDQLLHANAYHMAVTQENFSNAINRIEQSAGKILRVKRLFETKK